MRRINRPKRRVAGSMVHVLCWGSLVLVGGATPEGENYSIPWWSVDSGASSCSGGQFEMNATIGQPDAGAIMTGGDFAIIGGFWAGAVTTLPPCSGDFNVDTTVDLEDYKVLAPCIRGPVTMVPPQCAGADLNGDLKVDLKDAAIFANQFTGSGGTCVGGRVG